MSEVVATLSPMPNNSLKSLTKFFKTPKGLLAIALAIIGWCGNAKVCTQRIHQFDIARMGGRHEHSR